MKGILTPRSQFFPATMRGAISSTMRFCLTTDPKVMRTTLWGCLPMGPEKLAEDTYNRLVSRRQLRQANLHPDASHYVISITKLPLPFVL